MKKYRIKYKAFLILFLIVISFTLPIFYININKKDILISIGYTKEETNIINSKISKLEIDNIKDLGYISYLSKLVSNDNYHSEKLLSYIDYINKLTDYEINDVIYLVNNNINYDYCDKLLNIIHHKYFILSRLDRYMKYNSEDIDTIIVTVNSNVDRDFYTDVVKTDITKNELILVNKYYSIDNDYHYGELVTMDKNYDNKSGSRLSSVAYIAFKKLVDDAEKLGLHIRNISAYRSYNSQNSIYNNYLSSNGKTWTDLWSARPGHSEHQTGLALDVGIKNSYSLGDFEGTNEFNWMIENAHKYGFILRYPNGKSNITGYGYEPWHYRYVGVDVATYIYENSITLEEYYAYFIEK